MSDCLDIKISTESTDKQKAEFFLLCSVCALWLPCREDSLAPDFGLCPKRQYPLSLTLATDGCHFGVVSVE